MSLLGIHIGHFWGNRVSRWMQLETIGKFQEQLQGIGTKRGRIATHYINGLTQDPEDGQPPEYRLLIYCMECMQVPRLRHGGGRDADLQLWRRSTCRNFLSWTMRFVWIHSRLTHHLLIAHSQPCGLLSLFPVQPRRTHRRSSSTDAV